MLKNKILVTGGCGYIGSHTLIELLLRTSYNVISIDNLHNSSLKTLERVAAITNKTVKNYAIDLCDAAALAQVFDENPDIVGIIHFAALKSVPESVAQPLLYYRNNVVSLLNLLEITQQKNINYFIFSSSCSVYGNVSTLPVHENLPLQKAESPYAYTKQIGEEILKDFVVNSPTQVIALRYFNPVGAHISGLNGEDPRNPPTNLLPIITQTAARLRESMTVFGRDYATRDGSCVRDYVHVSDIANAHIIALQYLIDQKNTKNFDIFNLGTGNGITVLEAIEAFEKVTGITLNYIIGERRRGDVAAIYSDTTKSRELLGWKTEISLEEMMLSAWKWQQQMMKEK
jgi:UDP-glucose 4-epimerase